MSKAPSQILASCVEVLWNISDYDHALRHTESSSSAVASIPAHWLAIWVPFRPSYGQVSGPTSEPLVVDDGGARALAFKIMASCATNQEIMYQ